MKFKIKAISLEHFVFATNLPGSSRCEWRNIGRGTAPLGKILGRIAGLECEMYAVFKNFRSSIEQTVSVPCSSPLLQRFAIPGLWRMRGNLGHGRGVSIRRLLSRRIITV